MKGAPLVRIIDKQYVVLNKLVEFCHGKPLYFDEVTVRFIRDFQIYLKEQRGIEPLLKSAIANIAILDEI